MTKRYSVITRISIGLLSFFAGVVSTEIVEVKGAIAAPDPIFNPVLTEIRQKMPEEWSVRLPSNFSRNNPAWYADRIRFQDRSFFISIVWQPGCQGERLCTAGSIVSSSLNDDPYATRLLSEPLFTESDMAKVWKIRERLSKKSTPLSESEQNLLVRANSHPVISRAPITLKPGVKGMVIFTQGNGTVAAGNLHVVWEQESFIYRLSFNAGDPKSPRTQKDRANLINVAISMAKELPIESN